MWDKGRGHLPAATRWETETSALHVASTVFSFAVFATFLLWSFL